MKRKNKPVRKLFKYYKDFVEALGKIEGKYIAFKPFYSDDDKIRNSKDPRVKYAERVFAYEFYHQYRIIMDRKKKRYNNIQLNGEQEKDVKEFTAIKKSLNRFSPDLILHGSLSNTEKQYWICEIKMNHNPYPFEDLFKIGLYYTNEVKFNYYIFLYVGDSDNLMQNVIVKMIDYIKKEIKDKDQNFKKLLGDTICIFYNPSTTDDDQKVQAEWLCNILIDHGVVQASK